MKKLSIPTLALLLILFTSLQTLALESFLSIGFVPMAKVKLSAEPSGEKLELTNLDCRTLATYELVTKIHANWEIGLGIGAENHYQKNGIVIEYFPSLYALGRYYPFAQNKQYYLSPKLGLGLLFINDYSDYYDTYGPVLGICYGLGAGYQFPGNPKIKIEACFKLIKCSYQYTSFEDNERYSFSYPRVGLMIGVGL